MFKINLKPQVEIQSVWKKASSWLTSFTLLSTSCFVSVSATHALKTPRLSHTETAGRELNGNDVSVLLPLPDSVYHSELLRPETLGLGGELLPPEILNIIPLLLPTYESDVIHRALRVVGIRFDPCFAGTPDTLIENCQAQIRLIWQPLLPTLQSLLVLDAALHSFYVLTQEDFRALVEELKQLKSFQGPEGNLKSLSVHPTLQMEGFDSAYWKHLRKIILNRAGKSSLSRVTFMSTIAPDAMWDFGGFDLNQNSPRRIPIPIIKTHQQSFINRDKTAQGFRGGIRPLPNDPSLPSNLNPLKAYALLTGNSSSVLEKKELLQAALDQADTVENPHLRSPENTDCVTCHTAAASRNFVLKNSTSPFRRDFFYSARLHTPLEQNSTSTLNLRAFGYFGLAPIISQRVVNETQEVLERISR